MRICCHYHELAGAQYAVELQITATDVAAKVFCMLSKPLTPVNAIPREEQAEVETHDVIVAPAVGSWL